MKHMALSVLILVFLLTACKTENTSEISDPNPDNSALSIIAPNGGESLIEGSSYLIKWSGGGVNKLRLRYSIDNGINWHLIVDSLVNSGSYLWNPVPGRISGNCRIIINAINSSFSVQSNNLFSIIRNSNQVLELRIPNGSELWEAGTEHQIVWYSSGIDSVRIEYTVDDGAAWNLISTVENNRSYYIWKPVPYSPTTQAKVRIADAADNFPSAVSEKFFSILPPQNIILKTPDGGEFWVFGTEQKIEWESERIDDVKIEYTTNGGADWFTIVETTPNAGFYNWNNIPFCSSNLCKIRISDAFDSFPYAVSSNNFTISEQPNKSVRVASPNGGEIYKQGTETVIKWQSVNINYLSVEFSSNGGNSWEVIADRISGVDSLNWTVPDQASVKCYIKVKDVEDPDCYDISDAVFRIEEIQKIEIISPNGGEITKSGSTLKILWKSEGIEKIKIEYALVNGSGILNWIVLAADVQNNFTMELPFNVVPGEYKIRISDAVDGAPFDESDSVFIVVQ